MSTTNQIPENFTGKVEASVVCTNIADDTTRIISTSIKHYVNGQLHRDDGPAVESANGSKEWWKNGKRSRIDGPAVELANGTKEWWVAGQRMLEEQFDAFCRKIENKQKKALYKKLKAKLPPTQLEKKKKI